MCEAKIEEFDMMRNPEQTIGNLIDKQKTAFIASMDGDGFPNMKAMLSPRKRNGRYYANFKSEDFEL